MVPAKLCEKFCQSLTGVLFLSCFLSDLAMAQDPVFRRLTRPSSTLIEIELSSETSSVGSTIPGKVVGPGFGFVEEVEVEIVDTVDLSVRLPRSLAERLDRLDDGRKAFLYIPSIRLRGKEVFDSFAVIPTEFNVTVRGSIGGGEVSLNEHYIPDRLQKSKLEPTFWTAKHGEKRYEVTGVRETATPSVLILELENPPPNSAKIDIFYKKNGNLEKASSGMTTKAPKATSKDPTGNADLYTAFTLSNSNDTGNIFGIDTRGRIDLWVRGGGGGVSFLSPEWTLKANSAEQDDEDSLSLSLQYERVWLIGNQLNSEIVSRDHLELSEPSNQLFLESLAFRFSPKFESQKDFQNSNFVFDAELGFQPPVLGLRRKGSAAEKSTLKGLRVFLLPFVGLEGGWNADHEIDELDGEGVLRGKAGGQVQFKFEIEKPRLDNLTFDFEYVYRQLFEQETFVRNSQVVLPTGVLTTPAGEEVPVMAGFVNRREFVEVSEGPRRYLRGALRLQFNPSWEFNLSFSQGELPPVFKRVNKFELGFAYRFNTSYYNLFTR